MESLNINNLPIKRRMELLVKNAINDVRVNKKGWFSPTNPYLEHDKVAAEILALGYGYAKMLKGQLFLTQIGYQRLNELAEQAEVIAEIQRFTSEQNNPRPFRPLNELLVEIKCKGVSDDKP
jgi:hypothetical protein